MKLVSPRKTKSIGLHSYEDSTVQNRNIREGKQNSYKNREGDKTQETLKHGEQREGYWTACGGLRAKWVRDTQESTPEITVALYAT